MVLGKLPMLGRPAGLGSGRARAYCPCRGCGWVRVGVVWTFCTRLLFLFFLPLWKTARYRLKYSIKGRWTQNNQPNVASLATFLTTQLYAMLEYVKQKLHDVRENKADHVCM